LLPNKDDADVRNNIRHRFCALLAAQKSLTMLFYTTNTLKKLKTQDAQDTQDVSLLLI